MAQSRKKITNYREIDRLVYINKRIMDGKYPTTGKLAEELECSISTISRDIEYLRNFCHAPYEYDSQTRGYYCPDPNYQLKFETKEKVGRVEIADEKRSFSEYLNIPLSVLDKVEEISDLNLTNQSAFQANLSCKFIGRNYFKDGVVWIGLKAFDFTDDLKLTLSFYEAYQDNPKNVSFKLQGTKLNYISEYSAYDEGYWHYIIVDQKLLETKTEVARMELKNLIAFAYGRG